MSKKYELVKEMSMELENGIMVYRIKALRDFSNVKAGNLGGYIEKEDNLSHDGDCWVYDDAMVYDNAKIFDNAKVGGNAEVFDNAEVFGDARVAGNIRVYGNTKILFDPEMCDDVMIFNSIIIDDENRIHCNITEW